MHRLHVILLLLISVLMAACTAESDLEEGRTVSVRLNIATRAATRWVDTYATDAEMMNRWEVVVVDGSKKVVEIVQKDAVTSREIDDCGDIQLTTGQNYTFYSFANVTDVQVKQWLGITGKGSTVSNDDKAVAMAGNLYDPSTTGIPMSNKQTVAITATTTDIDLIVVRMLAKITLSLTNSTGEAVTVNSATLSDITANTGSNIMLFPNITAYPNDMDAHHKDIQPNVVAGAATEAVTKNINQTLAADGTHSVTFYVNESATPADGLFRLTLSVTKGGSAEEYRFTMISENDNTTNDWNYIARNDYRIIPLTLDDYELTLVPYDFPPIGVLPVSVKEVDTQHHVYAFTFHDTGHFHLVPHVTHRGTEVPYSSATTPTGTVWTQPTLTGSASDFYATSTDTHDTHEGGGAPVFDTTRGYIFGRIVADAGEVYHELKIKLYVDSQPRRDMLYRFYMRR